MEKQKQINQLQGQVLEHKSLLFATDYVVIRNQETGQGIPEDVKDMRNFARYEINRLEAEIAKLENQISEQTENVQL